MGQSPFAKRPAPQDSGASRRRSTRVDFVTPVILTGRSATGQTFREETETSTVNFHGAKLRTQHQVLVGMQVGVENPQNGLSEKAICVWVGETPPGQTAHDIAIQLLNSRNIWGLENPPADWQAVAETELRGHPAASPTVVKVPVRPASAPPSAAQTTRAAAAEPSADLQFAEMEQRSAHLMESVLQILRQQAEETVRNAIREFEERLKALVEGAEARVNQRAEKSYADLEVAVENLRRDLAEQLTLRTDQIIESTEEALRSKVAEMVSAFLRPGTPAGKTTDRPSKK